MDTPSARHAFLVEQISNLEPFGFLLVHAGEAPKAAVRVARAEEPGLKVDVLSALPGSLDAAATAALTGLGFTGGPEAWGSPSPPVDAADAARLVESVVGSVLGAPTSIDVRHGNGREEHEAAERLTKVRALVQPVLAALIGGEPEVDDDGDFVLDIGKKRLFVAVRAAPGRPTVVRVFAITNVGVSVTSELGLFLSKVNFDLTFGRFALDVEHQSVWFDETLLGEHITDEELRFTVEMVAETANEWDQRIAAMFGGMLRRSEADETHEAPQAKPGQGGYL